MKWKVSWELFKRERWLSARADRAAADRELTLWEHVVSCSIWDNVPDALAAHPRAYQNGTWVWFVLPLTGVRIGTELDFFQGRVWVRDIVRL